MTRALCLALALALAPVPAGAITVFDGANYAQNVLTAARALDMVNRLAQQVANQLRLIAGMERNLRALGHTTLPDLEAAGNRLDALLGRASGIPWRGAEATARHDALFPGSVAPGAVAADRRALADGRAGAVREGWRHSIEVQAGVVEGIPDSETLLQDLVARSQGAQGALEARQAGNQLQALGVRELIRTQALVAASGRADAVAGASLEAASRAARARFADSIGDGDLYRPLP